MKIVAIIQARMGSTRLPGKVLKKINDKSLLEYQIERVSYSKLINEVIVATTVNEADDSIDTFCQSKNIKIFRGSEEDVLSRYYFASKQTNADVIVRLTADCPVIDPVVIDEVIDSFISNDFDYVSNTLERTYPRGMDTEVFSYFSLEEAYNNAILPFEREHVTPYIYKNPSKFSLYNVAFSVDESAHRWTVDTEEDFLLIKKIINSLYSNGKIFSLRDMLVLLFENPEWKKINEHIEQKKLGE